MTPITDPLGIGAAPDTRPIPPDPPASIVVVSATPDTWRALIAVLMEAPVAGRVVAPLTALIELHLVAAGHRV